MSKDFKVPAWNAPLEEQHAFLSEVAEASNCVFVPKEQKRAVSANTLRIYYLEDQKRLILEPCLLRYAAGTQIETVGYFRHKTNIFASAKYIEKRKQTLLDMNKEEIRAFFQKALTESGSNAVFEPSDEPHVLGYVVHGEKRTPIRKEDRTKDVVLDAHEKGLWGI
jgi:hypothetical protein